jgi:parallel beta-helix repeat protein
MGKVTSHIMSKDMIDSKNKALVDLGSLNSRVGVVETSLTGKPSKTSVSQITVNASDYPTLQAALDYTASVKGKLKIPNGVYAVWGLNLNSDIQIEMDTYTYFDLTTAPDNSAVFNIIGSIGSKIPLSVDVSLYSMQLKVALGSELGFSIGDVIKITSNGFYDIDNRTNQAQGGQKKGELVKVASVTNDGTNGLINLLMPVVDSYTVANVVSIQKITPKKRIRIKGGKVFGHGARTQYGVNALYAENIKFEDLNIENTYTYGIYLKDCSHVNVDKCTFKDIPKSTVGYGVACYDACQDVTVTNSYFDHCKHAITTGGTGEGISNNIIFGPVNIVLRAEADAIDNHATCRQMDILHNKIYYGKGLGINFESPRGKIIGNDIQYCQKNGMEVRNWTKNTLCGWTISDNTIIHPVGAGIRLYMVGTTNSKPINSTISNNRIIMQDQTVSNTAFYHGIRLEGASDIVVTENLVVNADRGIYGDAACSNIILSLNNVRQTNRKIDFSSTTNITNVNNMIA